MDEKLSQSQIDELLRAFSGGGEVAVAEAVTEPVANVKEYDFRNPQKFSKEQLRSLEMIFDNFCRTLSSFLTGYLRVTTELNVANAEQVVFKEFANTLDNPIILAMVDFPPFKGSIIVQLSADIGYAIIDRILGGPGQKLKKIREFSQIESILLERVLAQTLTYLIEPWQNVAEVNPRLDRIETNSQFAQVIAPNETTALVTLEIKISGLEGFFNFVIPHMVIEPYMDRLNTRHWFMQKVSDDGDYAEALEDRLEKTIVPVKAIVGKTRITVQEFAGLGVGDIIKLDSFVDADMIVTVGDLYKYKAKPGVSRGKNAVKITSLIDKEELSNG
ncbi:MAG: flagellar motor switch protein FliM [Clostridiales bacterium]|jgi:flagellar motor switch protein FliM|nr:flagellar motor switch protein FliM [Clostridiales bacterium]